jgi:hypothetical protein
MRGNMTSKGRNKMHADCDQKEKIDQILINQTELGIDIKQAIEGLTKIIMADIEIRKDVEQLKKDREITFATQRAVANRIDAIEIRNAKCDGAGIFENFPKMYEWYISNIEKSKQFSVLWRWYLGELGWRRFIPIILSFITCLLALYVTFAEMTHDDAEMDKKEFKLYHSEIYDGDDH